MTDQDKNSVRWRVLFVCLGNICRSPAAEAIFKKMVSDHGMAEKIVADSAGTGGWHAGEFADPRMRKALEARGYLSTHRARQFKPGDFETFDEIYAMDLANLTHLKNLAGENPGALGRLKTMGVWLGDPQLEIPDPYYGKSQDFDHVISLLESALRPLVHELQKMGVRR